MGEEYQFICQECELEFTLGREKGGGQNSNSGLFYYNEINNKNSGSKSILVSKYSVGVTDNSIEIRELEVRNFNGKILVNCPNCFSNNVLIYKLDDWMENYQVW